MIAYQRHSGRKPHVRRFLKTDYRQLIVRHGWIQRGSYLSKVFGNNEYMMTTVRETGAHVTCRIQRKLDFWSLVTKEARHRDALEARKEFRVVGELP